MAMGRMYGYLTRLNPQGVPFQTARPALPARFRWPNGRLFYEAVLSWIGAPTAGLSSGIWFGTSRDSNGLAMPVEQNGGSFGFCNIGGVPTIVSGGTRISVAAYCGPLTGLNKFGMVLHMATADAEASADFIVNDRLVQTLKWGPGTVLPAIGADFNNAHRGVIEWYFGHGSIVGGLLYSQVHWGAGPDVGEL
jgi:hypothetical protein